MTAFLRPGVDMQTVDAIAKCDGIFPVAAALARTLVPATDRFVEADATLADLILTVPLAATVGKGVKHTIKRVDINVATFVKLVPSGADTFDFMLKIILGIPNEHVTLTSDGVSRWYVSDSRTQAFGSITY